MKVLTTKNLREMATKVLNRTPLSVVLVLILFGIFISRIAIGDMSSAIENIIGKSIITLIVMFLLSIGVYLLSEAYKPSRLSTWRNQIFTLVFGLVFYYSFEENIFNNIYAESLVYIVITTVGVISAIFVAPFIKKIVVHKARQMEFYIFGYKTIVNLIKSVTVGIITMLMGFVALFAINLLFGIDFDNAFLYWASFSLVLLAPMFFLFNLPSVLVDTSERIQEQKFFAFLVKYVALPAIVIYFVILYAYTIKVLANFSQWPQGEITWLVIIFSLLGYLVYSASYIFEQESKPIKVFRNLFPYIILPQIAMLFYAISLRINQYDLTINRYLVVIFGIWLLLISLYFLFSRRKYIGVIPLGLILAILIISIGPWSVYSYPESRQLANLEQNLIKAEILDSNGEIHPLSELSDISPELSGEIYGAIEYLCNYHGCITLEEIFREELLEIRNEHNNKSDDAHKIGAWIIVNHLTNKINVRRYYGDTDDSGVEPRYLSFFIGYSNMQVIEISGYDYYIEISSALHIGKPVMNEAQYKAIINIEEETLEIYKEGELIERLSIESILADIIENNPVVRPEHGRYRIDLNSKDLTFDLVGESLDVRMSFSNISIKNPEWERDEDISKGFPHVSGYVLIRYR